MDQRIKQTTVSRKILIFIACYLLYLAATALAPKLGALTGQIIIFGLTIGLVILIVHSTKTIQLLAINMKKVKNWFPNLLFWLVFSLFLLIVANIISNIENVLKETIVQQLIVLFSAITAELFEEFLVRVLLFDGLVQKMQSYRYSYLYAAIGSAIIFGLLHLSNLSFQSLEVTLQQVFYTIVIGLMFSYIRLRTNGIWLCVALHSLIDFQPTINEASTVTPWSILLMMFIPLILVSLYSIWSLNQKILQNE